MRTGRRGKSRPKSKHIIDRRSYFGSDALDTDYVFDDRIHTFLKESLNNTPVKLTTAPKTDKTFLSESLSRGALYNYLPKNQQNYFAPPIDDIISEIINGR